MTELATLVRRRRLDLRLTQREAAEKAGTSLATWQNLERPTSNADAFQDLTLARAAHCLRVDLTVLFEAAGRPTPELPVSTPDDRPPSADVEERIDHVRNLLYGLARRSASSFKVVYGQTVESAQRLIDLHDTLEEASSSQATERGTSADPRRGRPADATR